MPMLKTAPSGTTKITNVQAYLIKQQRQEITMYQREWGQYERGEIQLSDRQAGYLRDYLGQQSRGLAVDVSDDLSARNWARQMDITRAQYGHDGKAKQGKSRSYYHFILSPSIDDDCSLSTMRAYAKEWAASNFRNDSRCHEFAIVYHDDNTRGILHAHIVVNVTDKHSGRKLHLDNEEVVRLQLSAQTIGKRHGLTPLREKMQSQLGARTAQPIYLDSREREILNKGGYSWKWELRRFISDIAPLSNSFEDFKLKLNHAGYDVTRSPKSGYLTYTHRNGCKVKDSRLGARFYIESLERVFNHEQVLEDQTYSSWELLRISKGEVPWKEDIRRAIDAIAPTVVSVPELQQALRDRYGIRLIVNRRGIVYQHAGGFKVRDINIGFRYTLEGLRQNAVVGMTVPYPGYDAVLKEGSSLAKHYLPRSPKGIEGSFLEYAASRFVYKDMTDLMMRYGLLRIDEIAQRLDDDYEELKGEKADLANLRQEVMRWNHLTALQTRLEKDEAFLKENQAEGNPDLHNETLIRIMRIRLYLKQQAGSQDVRAVRASLVSEYESKLNRYQSRASDLSRDTTVYRNYLMMGGALSSSINRENAASSAGVEALFRAGRNLEKHRIRDFFHLEQTMQSQETQLDLVQFKLKRADRQRRDLEGIQRDIRTVLETKPYLPEGGKQREAAAHLDVDAKLIALKAASERLKALGIDESGYESQQEAYQEVIRGCQALREEERRIQVVLSELNDAKSVCLTVSDSLENLMASERAKTDARDFRDSIKAPTREGTDGFKPRAGKDEHALEGLPLEEARRRRAERIKGSPGRSERPPVERTR